MLLIGILSSNQGGWSNEEKYEVKGFIMCKGTVISDGPRKARQAIMMKVRITGRH